MLATSSLTTLLVNLQSMTSKTNTGGGSKDRVTWKVEEAMHNFVQIFYGLGKIVAAAGGLSRTGRGATPLQTSPQVFEHLLAPGSPGREWGRMLGLHIQDAGE